MTHGVVCVVSGGVVSGATYLFYSLPFDLPQALATDLLEVAIKT